MGMTEAPHVTFVDSHTGQMHLSDGTSVAIGGWLDHDGDPYLGGSPTPDTVRFCFSAPLGDRVIMVDLKDAVYGGEPEGRA